MTDTWPEACPTCEVIPTQDGGCQHYDLCWFCDTVIATAEGLRSCEAASSVGNAMINDYRQSQWQDLDAPPHSEPTTLAKHHNG